MMRKDETKDILEQCASSGYCAYVSNCVARLPLGGLIIAKHSEREPRRGVELAAGALTNALALIGGGPGMIY